MRIFDMIEWADDYGEELVHRVPQTGSGDFRLGSQLVVRESQEGVFVRDGKALDVFGPGRHTLETANLPLLTELIGRAFGGSSPFTAEMYFVSTRVFQNLKWGTKQPVIFRDPELRMVRLRAYGTFSVKVANSQLFISEIVGTVSSYDKDTVNDWMREFIVSRMIDGLGEFGRSILDLPMYYEELGAAIKARVLVDFAKYGLDVVDFNIGAITPPEEVQAMIDKRTSMSIVGDMGEYTQFQAANAISDAARNPGGMAGAGVGLGAGVAMGQVMAGAMQGATAQQPQQPAAQTPADTASQGGAAAAAAGSRTCPKCNHQNPPDAKFCMGCGEKFAQETGAFCPECGHKNPPGSKFCMECGTKIGG
jgi:membrane protease subunit (stomatin/prohibitin family)